MVMSELSRYIAAKKSRIAAADLGLVRNGG